MGTASKRTEATQGVKEEEEEGTVTMMIALPHPQVEEVGTTALMTRVRVGIPAGTGVIPSRKMNAAIKDQGWAAHPRVRTMITLKTSLHSYQAHLRNSRGSRRLEKKLIPKKTPARKGGRKQPTPRRRYPMVLLDQAQYKGPCLCPGIRYPAVNKKQANLVSISDTQEGGGQGRPTECGVF